MQIDRSYFNFYGVTVSVSSLCHSLLKRLERDFSLYLVGKTSEPAHLSIESILEMPPVRSFPHLRPTWSSHKVIVYDEGAKRVCFYTDRGQSEFNFNNESASVWAQGIELLHEITYLMILSRVGKVLDRQGVHRIHACGFRVDGKRVLLTMPTGGGKSTFFVEMSQDYPEIELMGDDTVLIDSMGYPHPFTIRVGLPEHFHEKFKSSTYTLMRREYGMKTLLPIELLGPKVLRENLESLDEDKITLLFGSRLEDEDRLSMKRIGRYEAFLELISPMIVGEGLAMIIEYFWETGVKDFWVKAGIALSRVRAAWRLSGRADCWRVELGTDRSTNSSYIREKLRR